MQAVAKCSKCGSKASRGSNTGHSQEHTAPSSLRSRWVFNSSSQRWTREDRPQAASTDASVKEVRSASISSTNEAWAEGDSGGAWWREVERQIEQDEHATNVGSDVARSNALRFKLHESPERFNFDDDDSEDEESPECSIAKRHKRHQPKVDDVADWWQGVEDNLSPMRMSRT